MKIAGQVRFRELPFQWAKYDNDTQEFDLEPNCESAFFSDGSGTSDSTTWTIPQAGANRGYVVGFDILEPPAANEWWNVMRMSDGNEDATDPNGY